ncbi:MAG: triple tyrosine motif-containing protein [Salinivirgaceae bacterium]|nr:triple tyrosine motif-containing protein [Salinivirgaceae bacterium]
MTPYSIALNQCIELVSEIYLTHKQSSFSFQIATLNYLNPQKNQISYKLEGYDKDWQKADKDQIATYNNVPSGTYTFSVRASNEDGRWNTDGQTVKITIKKPLWLSGWAIFIYLLIVSICAFYAHELVHKLRLINSILSFNINDKKAQICNLINPSSIALESADAQFLQKALQIVEENMANHDFDINQFCEKMNLSRSQIYRKINAIAGVSVSEFIKEVRLKRAAQLIQQKVANISEIAYLVGFNDPKYFGRCFKQMFGVSPIHYIDQNDPITPIN